MTNMNIEYVPWTVVVAAGMLLTVAAACTLTSTSPAAGDDGGAPSEGGTVGDGGTDAQPTLPFQPSNVTLTGHDFSAITDVDVSSDCSIDSGQSASAGFCDSPAVDWIATESDGVTKVHVFAVKSLRLDQNATLTIGGDFPAVIISFGDVSLLGQVKANAIYSQAGPGGYSQTTLFTAGSGPGGGPAGVFDGKGPPPGTGATAGISGGGATFCGLGAQGTQEGDTAGPLTVSPGPSKPTYGSADLRPLLAGSSGGTGTGTGTEMVSRPTPRATPSRPSSCWPPISSSSPPPAASRTRRAPGPRGRKSAP